jgi:hypothetical protein
LGARDAQRGVVPEQTSGQCRGDPGLPAVKKVARAVRTRSRDEGLQEIGTIDPADLGVTGAPAQPDHRHAVRRGQPGVVERVPVGGVAARVQHTVGVTAADEVAVAIPGGGEEEGRGPGQIEGMDAHVEDRETGRKDHGDRIGMARMRASSPCICGRTGLRAAGEFTQ